MLLLVDAGNTRVKWALVDNPQTGGMPGRWHASGAVLREQAVELGDAWRGARIARAIVSNVAGQPMRDHIERALLRAFGTVPVPVEWFASAPALAGVRNAYREPAQLGCDRFASAIGAHALFPGTALIVATCGTATTIDALTADGVFVGGMILPGLGLMATSLARNTAQLPQIGERIVVPQPFADNTHDAIVSGCIAAQAGAIERAFAAHKQRHRTVQCVLSGGAAEIIVPHLSMRAEQVDNLVLIGLHTAALKHTPC